MSRKGSKACAFAVSILCLTTEASRAGLTFYVDPGSPWPAGWYNAAVADMQTVVNEYNAYGDFTQGNPGNIYVYYNSGIPTAQSGYGGSGGSIGDGGTYPNVRVLLHESSHWLGTGTYSAYWSGPHAAALVQQFDGVGAVLNGDSQHYWPYGENYDSESSPVNDLRHVAMVYALRQDFGLVSVNPSSWAATNVTLTASDALGESGFNYPWTWSDNTFAHPNANYSTGNFLLRTPASGSSFTFAGASLTVNNTNGISGGLLYKGTGNTAVTTFNNLTLNGGYVRHASSSVDVFKLAGNVTLQGSPTIDAAQGGVSLSATITGSGSFTKSGTYPLILTTGASYAGNTTITAGILRLGTVSPVASYTFDSVSGSTVINSGTGGAAMNGTLANGASVVPTGHSGSAVSLTSGASVDINNPITDLGNTGNWTVSAWVKTATPGATLLSKSDGTNWSSGNTIFYLGDGTAGGSGGIPSAVRWGGGFLQASPSSTPVNNNAWHQITYVNSGGTYSLYVDGVAQPLSPGNAGFSNADVGSIVRLGLTTDAFAGDGTTNFNGLLDDVRFYSQALSPTQLTSLYQGSAVTGSLPSTTNVTIASGATLDLSGATQQIASLTGPAGSAVSLGAGKLIITSPTSSTFAGTISGSSGSLTKSGTASLTLTGNNSYTGPTSVSAGTLTLGRLAWSPILTSAASTDLSPSAILLLDYTGTTSPLSSIESRISTGYLHATSPDPTHTLGTLDNPATSTVAIQLTLIGDANVDGIINADDYAVLDRGFANHLTHWSNGDFNYDGTINQQDYLLIDRSLLLQGGTLSPGTLADRQARFGDAYVSDLFATVPEPSVLASVALPLTLLLPHSRRRGRRPL